MSTPTSRHCRRCSYCLDHLTADACPECGRSFDPEDPKTYLRSPTRRHPWRRLAVIAVCAGLIGTYWWALPRISFWYRLHKFRNAARDIRIGATRTEIERSLGVIFRGHSASSDGYVEEWYTEPTFAGERMGPPEVAIVYDCDSRAAGFRILSRIKPQVRVKGRRYFIPSARPSCSEGEGVGAESS